MTTYLFVPSFLTRVDPYPDFKVAVFFTIQYMKNGARHSDSYY